MIKTERENVRKLCRYFLAEKLQFLNLKDEKWVLEYLASGKGMIPYELITDFESLNLRPPEGFFFSYNDFYLSLKEKKHY